MKFLFYTLSLVAVTLAQSEIDWCAYNCGTASPHVACPPNGLATPVNVTNVQLVQWTQAQKDAVLQQHNAYRNAVASGKWDNVTFPTATKMGEMLWDNTLQYLAEQHAKYGHFAHDKCRKTTQYPYSGQNLYMYRSSPKNNDISKLLALATTTWFETEVRLAANPAFVTNLLSAHAAVAGHFTVMVNDKNNRVGCGAATYNQLFGETTWYGIIVTCNYQYNNMVNSPTYVQGALRSECAADSSNYKALCAPTTV